MNNIEIAGVLRQIADLLESKKDGWFKIRAYRRAADSIESLADPVADLIVSNRLRDIPGVGEAITKKITELVATGRLEYLERLRAELLEAKE